MAGVLEIWNFSELELKYWVFLYPNYISKMNNSDVWVFPAPDPLIKEFRIIFKKEKMFLCLEK